MPNPVKKKAKAGSPRGDGIEWDCLQTNKSASFTRPSTLFESKHLALVESIRDTPVTPRQMVQPNHLVPNDKNRMPAEHFMPVGVGELDFCPCPNRICDCEAWINNNYVCCYSGYVARDLWETYLAAEKLYGPRGGNLYLASMIQPDPTGKKTKQSVYKIPFVYAPGHVRIFYLCVQQYKHIFRLTTKRVTKLTALSKRREATDKQDCGPYRWCGKDKMTYAVHTKENHCCKATYFPKPATPTLGATSLDTNLWE